MNKLRVVLTSDTSGSMSGKKLKDSIKAQGDFIKQIPAGSEVGLVSFGGRAKVVQNLSKHTGKVKRSLRKSKASGGTPLYNGLKRSLDVITGKTVSWMIHSLFKPQDTKKTNPPPIGGNRAIVLSTDGHANGGKSTKQIIKLGKRIKDKNIKIVTIAIGSSADKTLLKQLASTKEDFHVAKFSGDLPDLYKKVAHGLVRAKKE